MQRVIGDGRFAAAATAATAATAAGKLRRQLGYIRRDAFAGRVKVSVTAKPLKVIFGISVRAGQTIGRRRGKALAIFHDDLNILSATAQRAAAKGKGNGLQSARTQCVRVQDFKDGAETKGDIPIRGRAATPEAGRVEPANRTEWSRIIGSGVLPPGSHPLPVFDISVVLVQHLIPFVDLWRAVLGLIRACTTTSRGRRTQCIVHAACGVVLAENQICGIQVIPAYRMRYIVIRNKQAVGIFVLLCIFLGGFLLRCELVSIHCSGVGKGNIVQRRIRQGSRAKDVSGVHRAGNARAGEVKVIGAAGNEVELLWGSKLCRQLGYICRNAFTGCVQVSITAKPLKAAAVISVRACQTIGRRRGKCTAVFHDDLNILGAIPQLAAAKVEGNDLQPVSAQRVRVQDFKDGAKTEDRVVVNSRAVVGPVAGRIGSANRTETRSIFRIILSPRKHPAPVFDVSFVLVHYHVPFVALGVAAF